MCGVYSGQMRIERLKWIAKVSNELNDTETALDASNRALEYLKESNDIESLNQLNQTLGRDELGKSIRQIREEESRLTKELKIFYDNMIKESIRMGLFELCDFYMSTGNYKKALDCLYKAREHCVNISQLIACTFNEVRVGLLTQDFSLIQRTSARIQIGQRASLDLSPEQLIQLDYIQCASGIAEMNYKNYTAAVDCFRRLEHFHSEIASEQSVAWYGTLCGLICLSRKDFEQFQKDFKVILENQVTCKDLVYMFLNCNLRGILSLLNSYKDTLRYDLFLDVEMICEIRERFLILYCNQFVKVKIDSVSDVIGIERNNLNEKLRLLISCEKLNFRIDEMNEILVSKEINSKRETLCIIEKAQHKFNQLQELFK